MHTGHHHHHDHDHDQVGVEQLVHPSQLEPLTDLSRLLEETSLLLVHDEDQVSDHAGKPVPPMTEQGRPYRWKLRLRNANLYASTADELLAAFIADYDPDPHRDGWNEEAEFAQARRRGTHLLGLVTTHVATAALNGDLNAEKLDVLARSLPVGRAPLTEDDIAVWDDPNTPLLLMADLYDGDMVPPGGNVIAISTGDAQEFLLDLAQAGFLTLQQNPTYDSRSTTTVDL